MTGCSSFCHKFNQKQILSDLNEPVCSNQRRKKHISRPIFLHIWCPRFILFTCTYCFCVTLQKIQSNTRQQFVTLTPPWQQEHKLHRKLQIFLSCLLNMDSVFTLLSFLCQRSSVRPRKFWNLFSPPTLTDTAFLW